MVERNPLAPRMRAYAVKNPGNDHLIVLADKVDEAVAADPLGRSKGSGGLGAGSQGMVRGDGRGLYMTFPRQITDPQLSAARPLVETTDRSIEDIALAIGMTKNTLWRYIREGEWDRRGRTSGAERTIPDDLPYWRFRVYKKLRREGANHADSLTQAQSVEKVAA